MNLAADDTMFEVTPQQFDFAVSIYDYGESKPVIDDLHRFLNLTIQ
jgi:hypothetical protein